MYDTISLRKVFSFYPPATTNRSQSQNVYPSHVKSFHSVASMQAQMVTQDMQITTLFMHMLCTNNRTKFSFFPKKFQMHIFNCHIWILHEKCIQMSINKPSIGPVVLEVVFLIWENLSIFFKFVSNFYNLH